MKTLIIYTSQTGLMKMFVTALKNKKNATEKERFMAEKMASSYDISDIKYIEPIVSYLGE